MYEKIVCVVVVVVRVYIYIIVETCKRYRNSSRSKGLLEPNWLHIVSAKGTRPDPTETTCFSTSGCAVKPPKKREYEERWTPLSLAVFAYTIPTRSTRMCESVSNDSPNLSMPSHL